MASSRVALPQNAGDLQDVWRPPSLLHVVIRGPPAIHVLGGEAEIHDAWVIRPLQEALNSPDLGLLRANVTHVLPVAAMSSIIAIFQWLVDSCGFRSLMYRRKYGKNMVHNLQRHGSGAGIGYSYRFKFICFSLSPGSGSWLCIRITDPDQHWFTTLERNSHRDLLWNTKLDPDPQWNKCESTLQFIDQI